MRAEVFGRPRMAVLGTIRGRRECLSRPGQIDIQTELFYDYRSNVERYPQWQRYLREHRPPTLVVWGKYMRRSRWKARMHMDASYPTPESICWTRATSHSTRPAMRSAR